MMTARVVLSCELLALALVSAAAVSMGTTHIAWPPMAVDQVILWSIRAPRVLVGATVGAGLGTAGAIMQGLFRNPLAEPGLVGVGPGAVLGAVVVFVTGLSAQSIVILPLAAMLSSLLVLLLVFVAARAGGAPSLTMLLLVGIGVGSMCTAAAGLLISSTMAAWQSAQEIVFWMMGGIDARAWVHVWLSAPFVAVGFAAAMAKSRDLDALALGAERAGTLGVDVTGSTHLLLGTAAVLTGASVAVAGLLPFVGLVVPHVVRLVLGPRHRTLLPASALAGAIFVVACDLLARTVHPPAEIRLGIITSLVGSPLLIWILLRRAARQAYA